MKNVDKKRHYIYLAGNISDDIRTYEWREKFTKLMKDDARIIIVNPCKNPFNQKMKNICVNGGLEFTKAAKRLSQHILRPKDYQLISMCSVVVVNLGLVSLEKPMIGTIQELCWCHDIFYMPVIAILNGADNAYTNHPWIAECCSAKVDTVEESIQIIKEFFLDY